MSCVCSMPILLEKNLNEDYACTLRDFICQQISNVTQRRRAEHMTSFLNVFTKLDQDKINKIK